MQIPKENYKLHSSTKSTRETLVLLPAYQEAIAIGEVIKNIRTQGYSNILVVDDGSSDETSKNATEAGAKVLRHTLNRGKGAALRTGFKGAQLLNADVIVTMDADGQHDPDDIKALASAIEHGADVALGTRAFTGKHMPQTHIVANKIANFITYLLAGLYVHDSQCGFRAYSRKALGKLYAGTDGFAYESEIVKVIRKQHLSFVEIPVKTIYTDYSRSKKNGQNFINGLKTLYNLIFT